MGKLDRSEVMSFTVFKVETECLSYQVKVTSEYEPKHPEYLEQLHVIGGVLQAHIEKSEHENLQDRLNMYREIRTKISMEREAKSASSGPTGGEQKLGGAPKPDGDSGEEGED